MILLRLALIHEDAPVELLVLMINSWCRWAAVHDVDFKLNVSCRLDLTLLVLQLLKVELPNVTQVLAIIATEDEHLTERLD